MQQYTKIEGTEKSYVKFEIYYDKGGMNYFNGRTEPRGYWASVRIVEREQQERGIVIESFSVFGAESGFKKFLFEVKKQSQKSHEKAIAEGLAMREEMTARLLGKNVSVEKAC